MGKEEIEQEKTEGTERLGERASVWSAGGFSAALGKVTATVPVWRPALRVNPALSGWLPPSLCFGATSRVGIRHRDAEITEKPKMRGFRSLVVDNQRNKTESKLIQVVFINCWFVRCSKEPLINTDGARICEKPQKSLGLV